MASVFTRVISGELPGRVVWRDDVCAVLLPLEHRQPGHVLVVPHLETDQWVDLPGDVLAHLMAVAQRVGEAQRVVWSPARIGVIIEGYEVSHVHIHVWPSLSGADFGSGNQVKLDASELDAIADKLRVLLGDSRS